MDFLPAAKHTLQAMTIVGLMVGCATETNNPVVPPPGGVGAHRIPRAKVHAHGWKI